MNDWITDDILVLIVLRRKYESLWRKTRLTVHFDMYSESCMDVKTAISKIDNIRAEFPLLEANLPCYSFLSMDSIMPICTTTLYHFDRVTDPEL